MDTISTMASWLHPGKAGTESDVSSEEPASEIPFEAAFECRAAPVCAQRGSSASAKMNCRGPPAANHQSDARPFLCLAQASIHACCFCLQGQGSCCTGSSGAPGCMAPLDCCKFRNTGCSAIPPVLAPAPAPLVSEAPAALPPLVVEAPAPAPVVCPSLLHEYVILKEGSIYPRA